MNNLENTKTPLSQVLEKLTLSQQDILRALEKEKNITIDKANFSKIVNGKRKITEEIENALSELYGINPAFLEGKSNDMFLINQLSFQTFAQIFKEWKITEYDDPNEEQCKQYLHLTMDKNLYDFLINFDKVNLLKEHGMECFNQEISKYKENFLQSGPQYEEYVLIPRNQFMQIPIVGIREHTRKKLQEILDLVEYKDYTKSKLKLKINTTQIKK